MNSLFNDYEGFVDKFKVKKTTDDCYTPDDVYDKAIEFVRKNIDITGLRVARPFFPGGDYESFDYNGSIVIDNPPFSIISKIVRFYSEMNIKFFLFCPHLTSFYSLSIPKVQVIVNDGDIIYKNGAVIRTDFVTNIFPGLKVLYRKGIVTNKVNKVAIRKINFPVNVFSSARIKRSRDFEIKENECVFEQTIGGTKIFGGGILVSDAAAKRVKDAEMKDAEMKDAAIDIPFTNSEKEIVNFLNKKDQDL